MAGDDFNTLSISMQAIAASIPKGGALENRMKAAMRRALTSEDCWLCSSEDQKLRAAIATLDHMRAAVAQPFLRETDFVPKG